MNSLGLVIEHYVLLSGVIFTPSGEMATVYSLPSSSSSRLIVLSSFVAIPPSAV